MLKVVIDTNQFVSSVINKRGPSAELLDAWRNHHFVLILSTSILDELKRVLLYPHIFKKYKLTQSEIDFLVNLLEHDAIMVSGSLEVNIVKDDPDDNKFLACALEAEADYIVSGDSHLLSLKSYKDISILSVNEFLQVLKRRN